MKFLLKATLCLVWSLHLHAWNAIFVPISFNTKNKGWNVLLGKDSQGDWRFFSRLVEQESEANRTAIDAFNEQTNNAFLHVKTEEQARFKSNDRTIIYFVEVAYVPKSKLRGIRKTLRKKANQERTDYIWVSVDRILDRDIVRIRRGVADSSVKSIMNTYWPEVLKKLNKKISEPTEQHREQYSWNTLPGTIYFYHSNKPYYEFTNFASYSVKDAEGHIWPTSENYFQAQKFVDNPLRYDQMKQLETPREAFEFVRQYADEYDKKAWNTRSVGVMLDAVRRKFTQHSDLRHKLENTGDEYLVEDAGANDSFWGTGQDGQGANILGQVLMRIRSEITGRIDPNEDFEYFMNPRDYFRHENAKIVHIGQVLQKVVQKKAPAKKSVHIKEEKFTIEHHLLLLQKKLTELLGLLR